MASAGLVAGGGCKSDADCPPDMFCWNYGICAPRKFKPQNSNEGYLTPPFRPEGKHFNLFGL